MKVVNAKKRAVCTAFLENYDQKKTQSIFYTGVNNFPGLAYMKFYVVLQFQPNCGMEYLCEHSHILHDQGISFWHVL